MSISTYLVIFVSTNVDVSMGTYVIGGAFCCGLARCLAIAGPGVVGNMLMLLDRGAVTFFQVYWF